MNHQIYALCVFEYISSLKILIFYSPLNHININKFKLILTGINFDIKQEILLSFKSNQYEYYFMSNIDKIIFCVITNNNYSKGLVLDCIKELEIQFSSKYPTNYKQEFKELQINSQFTTICKKIYNKYNNLEYIDDLVLMKNKVNNVKEVMHENISQSMDNLVKLETIQLNSEELQLQTGKFNILARELKNKIWWQHFKTKLIIFSIIVIILSIIIAVIIVELKAK